MNAALKPAGAELRRLREAAGLSRAKVAKKLGIAPSSYQHYEIDPERVLLPVPLVRGLVPILAGKGEAMIHVQDVWALAGLREAPAIEDPNEASLLAAYRGLDRVRQRALLTVAEAMKNETA